MKRVMTFLSDFGPESPYPAAMKAVAASIAPAHVRFIDITHEIRPQGVCEGAFVLWSVAPYCPEGTVHCAVVDPGVGTERRGVIFVCEGQLFVGPDNGLLIPAAEARGVQAAYEIDLAQSAYVREQLSSTFHGRDVFAPAAAHLACGVPPEEIGPPLPQWTRLDVDFRGGQFDESERAFQGQLVYIDPFGNAITNIPAELVLSECAFGQALALRVHGRSEHRVRLKRSFGYANRGELCVVPGSHGLIEIAVREGSARDRLGLHVYETVVLAL